MGKMIYLMGKSSSGKDTIYKQLLKWDGEDLKKVVLYTTRPIRAGEVEGKQYHFTDEAGYEEIEAEGRVIEARAYCTYHGLWRYFTVDDGQIDLEQHNYLAIGTLESYVKTAEYFGWDRVVPILLELDDGIRLQRALTGKGSRIIPDTRKCAGVIWLTRRIFPRRRSEKLALPEDFPMRI